MPFLIYLSLMVVQPMLSQYTTQLPDAAMDIANGDQANKKIVEDFYWLLPSSFFIHPIYVALITLLFFSIFFFHFRHIYVGKVNGRHSL